MWRSTVRTRIAPRWAQRPSVHRLANPNARYANTASEAANEAPKQVPKQSRRGRTTVVGASLAVTLLIGYVYATDTRASIHRYGLVPLIRCLYPDAEDAHHSGVDALKTLYKFGLNPRERGNPDGDGSLATEVHSPSRGWNIAQHRRFLDIRFPTRLEFLVDLTNMQRFLIRCLILDRPLSRLEAPRRYRKKATLDLVCSESRRRRP